MSRYFLPLFFNPSSILNVSAIVLANLCVSYIMTSQNEEAEELMRKIEKEEEQVNKKEFGTNYSNKGAKKYAKIKFYKIYQINCQQIFFQLAYEDPDRKVFHLCIVNLVIGEKKTNRFFW